jgi:hypothetical protein
MQTLRARVPFKKYFTIISIREKLVGVFLQNNDDMIELVAQLSGRCQIILQWIIQCLPADRVILVASKTHVFVNLTPIASLALWWHAAGS